MEYLGKQVTTKIGKLGFESIFCVLGIAFLVAPIFAIIPLAFTKSQYLQIDGFSFHWLIKVIGDVKWIKAFAKSMFVATATSLFSILIALPASEFIRNRNNSFINIYVRIAILPLGIPIVVMSVVLYVYFSALNITDTLFGIILAHTLLGMPIALLLINAFTVSFFAANPNIESAAYLMGIGDRDFFLKITLPNIRLSIFLSLLLTFSVSFNESVIVQFLSDTKTILLSKKIFDGIKFEINPEVPAVAFLLIVLTLFLLVIKNIASKRWAMK